MFKKKGRYTLTASITDEWQNRYCTKQHRHLPVAEVKLTLPAVSHTDKTITLQTETKETDGLALTYTLTRNGEPADIGTFIEGIHPMAASFKEKGVYVLTASVTDATGRVFADTADITVYPVDQRDLSA